MATHLLGAAKRTVGGAGFVLTDDGVQGILALAGVDDPGDKSLRHATLAAPLIREAGGLDALAPENDFGFSGLGVLGHADRLQHALVVDVPSHRLVYRQMHAGIVEGAGFIGDEGQLGRVKVE
ncbi:hypothetical protein D3C71_1572630 [compost metagenome]